MNEFIEGFTSMGPSLRGFGEFCAVATLMLLATVVFIGLVYVLTEGR